MELLPSQGPSICHLGVGQGSNGYSHSFSGQREAISGQTLPSWGWTTWWPQGFVPESQCVLVVFWVGTVHKARTSGSRSSCGLHVHDWKLRAAL